MRHASILADLAEEVLAVYQMESAAPELLEMNAVSFEFLLLPGGHQSDEIRLAQAVRIGETLSETVAGAGTRHDEIHFVEVSEFTVIDVGDELVGEEVADCRIGVQHLEAMAH